MDATANQVMNRRSCLVGLALAGARTVLAAPVKVRLLAAELQPPWVQLPVQAQGKLDQLARQVGQPLRAEYLPSARVQREASLGPSLVYPLARIPGRELQWHWLTLLAREELVLWVRRDALAEDADAADLLRLRVGVLHQSMHIPELAALGFLNTEPAIKDAANARKLSRGRIQAWATLNGHAHHWMAQERIDCSPFHPPIQLGTVDLYLAATRDFNEQQLSGFAPASSVSLRREFN